MVHILRHLFLPHHTNNFRAKVLHLDFFLFYIAAFFVMTFSFRTIHFVNPDILGYATDIRVQELLRLTNDKRQTTGLTTLQFNQQLSEAAAEKANYMFSHNFWAHVAPDGTTPWDFINNSGYVYVVAGENLAKNFSDSNGVVEAWMNSRSHRDNLLRSDYQDIGFAVVNGVLNGEETTLVVQMFGKKLAAPVAQKPVASGSLAKVAEANENTSANTVAQVVATPTPEVAALKTQNQPQKVEILQLAGSVIKKPFLDINSISKKTLFTFSAFLLVVMVFDGIYIWRQKIVRAGGKHMAHIFFLFLMTSFVWLVSFGSVL